MGSWFSSNTEKAVDTNGNVNNNLVFEGPVDFQSIEILTMLGIICAIKIIEVLYLAFNAYRKSLKKRYSNSTAIAKHHPETISCGTSTRNLLGRSYVQ